MRTMITVAITKGTLMAKIQRHVATSMSQPPASGPMTNAMPPHAVHEPIAAPRSSGGKRRDDDGQRARGQQRAEDALQGAPGDEHLDRRGQRADDADDAEAGHAEREDPPLAVEVAERAADEDERAEREQIGVGDPLLPGEAAAEVALDGRQRDVDGGRVERRDERAEDRGEEREALAAIGHEHHATQERTCVCGGSGGWAPTRPQTARDAVPNRLGCSPPCPPPRGQVTASERRASQPLGLALCGSVPRRGATYERP